MILYAAIHTHTHSVHRNFHMKQLIIYFCDNISVVRHKWFHRHEIINNQGPFLKSVLEAYFIWVNRKKVVDAWCFCNGDRYVQETWKLIWAPKADIFDYTAAFCSFFKCEWAFPCPVSPAWLFLVRCVCGQSHSQTTQYILHVHQTVERDTPFQKPIPWLLKDAKAIKTIAANLSDFLLNLPLWGSIANFGPDAPTL